jgi:DNA-binding NtrC family response regulator
MMGAKENLLIIDDEIEVLNTLKRVFHKDYNLHITESPKEAFEIMDKFDIGVILCDQRMPEMKGTEFFKKVKDLYPDTIRILITGYSELSDVIYSINEGNIF